MAGEEVLEGMNDAGLVPLEGVARSPIQKTACLETGFIESVGEDMGLDGVPSVFVPCLLLGGLGLVLLVVHLLSPFQLALDKLKPELDKCVLVCKNCHGEINSGLVSPPGLEPGIKL